MPTNNDLIDTVFLSDANVKKIVEEINKEIKGSHVSNPFSSGGLTQSNKMKKDVHDILTGVKDIKEITDQIKGMGWKPDADIDKITEDVNKLRQAYADLQEQIESTANAKYSSYVSQDENGHYSGGEVEVNVKLESGEWGKEWQEVIDEGENIGEEIGASMGKGLVEELNAYVGQRITKSIIESVENSLSNNGVDVGAIVSESLGLAEPNPTESITKGLYSELLDKIILNSYESNLTTAGNVYGIDDESILNRETIKIKRNSVDDEDDGGRRRYARTNNSRPDLNDDIVDAILNGEASGEEIGAFLSDIQKTNDYDYSLDRLVSPEDIIQFANDEADGKGIIGLITNLRNNYARILEIADDANISLPTAFEKLLDWDAEIDEFGDVKGDFSQNSKNIGVLYSLLNEGGLDAIITQMNKTQWKTRLPETLFDPNVKFNRGNRYSAIKELTGEEVIAERKTGRKNTPAPGTLREYRTNQVKGGKNLFDEVNRDAIRLREIFTNDVENVRKFTEAIDKYVGVKGGRKPLSEGELYELHKGYGRGGAKPGSGVSRKPEVHDISGDGIVKDVEMKGGGYNIYIDRFDKNLPEPNDISSHRDPWKTRVGNDYAPDPDREIYDPTKPSEVIDGTTLTVEELQSLLGDGVVIKDVSSSTEEIIKSGLADDFFGSYHDDGSNGEGISEEDFWKQQWESFQKIADIFKIPQIVNLLQKINERIYVFGTNTARALSSIKDSVDKVDVKFEVPKDATFQVFKEGARPSFNIPNPFFDENGENIFLKMARDGFGVVNGNEQQNKKLKKYRQSYNNSAEWENYNERVDKLTKLSKSDNPEYRAFAEHALSEAKSMRDKGFNDRVRNQDLFMGLFEGKLPNMENFSFEDYGKFAEEYDYYMKTWNVVSHYTYEQLGEEIAKVNKQIAELESTGPSGDKGGMNNLEIDNKLAELNKRKNDLLSNYNKFLLDEDELIYLEMMVKVYGSLLRGRAPYGKYKKRLESFLTLVNKGEFEASKQMSARIAEMEIGLKSIGADVSDIISKVLEKTNADLDGYRKELKSAKSGSAKKTLEKQIKALEEFKTHLENLIPDEGILPGYVSEYPNVFNPSTLNSAKMYEVVNDYAHGEGVGDHALNVSSFGSLVAQYSQLRQQIIEGQYAVTIEGASKESIESFNKLVERLRKVHDAMFGIVQKAPEFKEYFQTLTIGYQDVALSAESLIEKTKELGNVSKASLDSLTQQNQKGLASLFGGSIKWDETGNAIANVGKESSQATSNFTKFTNNFDRATRAITGAGGALTWFFSVVGSGQALNDMVTASSLRQTNQIMLSARRGTEEATKLYDRIQMLVVKLPGNDTFLTNILTMLGTMDKSLTGEDLEYMGGVIADYYMGAQAKGQFNNETERELRNYLMTGQTRNLTNSIIASEIESLKGLNSVKERTIALEKALQKTGMDSIAHYDSYTNTFEEFKGRFQKSFADWGDVWLGFLQLGMKTYNTLDSLSNSFLSQATIAVGVIVMGFIGLIGVLGTLVGMLGQVVGGLEQIQKFMNAPFGKDDDPYTLAIKKFIYWTLAKVKAIDEDTYATNVNSISEEINAGATLDNVKAKITSSWSSLQEGLSKIWNTVAIYDEATANTVETATEFDNALAKNLNRLWTMETASMEVLNAQSKIWSAVATDAESASEVVNAESKNLNLGATLRGIWGRITEIATKIGVIISTMGEALAVQYEAYVKGEASFTTFALASGNIVLTGTIESLKIALGPVGAIFEIMGDAMWLVILLIPVLVGGIWAVGDAFGVWGTIGSALGAVWDAVAGFVGAIVGGLGRIWDAFVNNEKIQYAMYIISGFFENLMAFFDMSFLGGIWELLFGTGTGEEFDILSGIIDMLGAIGEFIWWISSMDEIIEVLRSVGALLGWVMSQWNAFVDSSEYQDLIDGFREIRVAIGEIWTEIAPVFDELGKAWAELWGDEEGAEKLKEDGNELLELFKAIARFIRDYVVPFIKLLVPLIKATLMPLVTVVKFITWIIEGVKWISDHFGMQNDKAPTNIANKEGGYNTILEKQYQYDYAKGKDLAKRYINNNNGNSTIINNNFSEGSVQPDARNMTKKEVKQLFTSAFGYNQGSAIINRS